MKGRVMEEIYLKEEILREKDEEEKDIELIKSILSTKSDLEKANKNFEYAEEELIDYYTYQIKANQAKLDYLIKQVKKRGIILDIVNQIEFKLNNQKVV